MSKVLLLRDVLGWRASEVARELDLTPTAVNGLLQRARARLERVAPDEEAMDGPVTVEQSRLLDLYVSAFENRDLAALVRLLASDVVWEMPPFITWFRGARDVAQHIAAQCNAGPGDLRLAPHRANDQPAFSLHKRTVDGFEDVLGLQVLALRGAVVSRVITFGPDQVLGLVPRGDPQGDMVWCP